MEISEEVRETFVLHNRSFQRYAIDNSTYFVPVDEVRRALLTRGGRNRREVLTGGLLRMKPFDYASNIES